MRAEDFAAWLSAISGMSEGQRREAMAALEKTSEVGSAAGASAKKVAIGVLVSALNVPPQALQRARKRPCEWPQPTISRPAQWGQP